MTKSLLKKIKKMLNIMTTNNNDLETEEGRSNERFRRMTWTSAAALFAQILQIAIPLITVRITLAYMGTAIYALWATVNTLFSLMTYADMGLGNGLQTRLSQETGNKENFRGRAIVSSTYFVLTVIAIILGLILCFIFPRLDWVSIVGVEGKDMETLTSRIVLAIIIPKIISIPLSLIRRCQNAMQDGFVAYMWQAFSSLLSLASIYITILLDRGAVAVILVSSCIPIVIYIFNSITYFKKNRAIKPTLKDVQSKESLIMLKIGLGFFILSLLNAIGLNMDNYIVARAASLESVTSFSIALRVTQMLNIACTILSAPLWAANGEALVSGDVKWVKQTTKKMSYFSIAIVIFAAMILLPFGPQIFTLWLGHDIGINRILLLGLILMQLAFSFVSPYFMVLNASGRVKLQIGIFAVFTPISLFVKYIICKNYGAEWMSFAGAIIYFFIVAIPVYLSVRKQLYCIEGNKSE